MNDLGVLDGDAEGFWKLHTWRNGERERACHEASGNTPAGICILLFIASHVVMNLIRFWLFRS